MEKINFNKHYETIRSYADPESSDYALLRDLALSNKSILNLIDGSWYSESLDNLQFDGFLKKGKLQYTVENPVDPLQFLENHLVVVFPGAGTILDSDACSRMYGRSRFGPMSLLSKSIIKNTYILRIADTNLISGSYYTNTENYPDYESEIQELILDIRDRYSVKHENVLLWGESRGAIGALIHGILGSYKTLSIDPIVNRQFFSDEDDYHFQFNLVPVDFAQKLNNYAQKSRTFIKDIVILTHHDSVIAFPYINQLDKRYFKILDLNYDLSVLKLTSPKAIHGFLIAKSVPIQLAIINQLLLLSSLNEVSVHQESDYYLEDFDSTRPIVSEFFNHRYREHFIEIYNNSKLPSKGEWTGIEFRLKKKLSSGKVYNLSIELLKDIPEK